MFNKNLDDTHQYTASMALSVKRMKIEDHLEGFHRKGVRTVVWWGFWHLSQSLPGWQRIGNAHPLEDNHSMSSKKVTSNMIRGAKCLKKELFLGTEMTPDRGQLTYIKLNKKKTCRGRV